MRLFYALTFDSPLQREVARVVHPLVEAAPALAWVPAERLHVTLKFLGEVPEAEIRRFEALGREAVRGVARHEVILRGVGAFPNLRRPRVVWLGMQDADALAHLAEVLDDGAGRLGIERSGRVYRPHVTLARVRVPVPGTQLEALARLAPTVTSRMPAPVRDIALVRSTPGPGGSRYDVLHSFALDGH